MAADRSDGACPRELLVGTRRGQAELAVRSRQEFPAHGVAPGCMGVAFDGGLGVVEDVQKHADPGFGRPERCHGVHVAGGRAFPVAGRVPERGPTEGPGHGVGDPVQEARTVASDAGSSRTLA